MCVCVCVCHCVCVCVCVCVDAVTALCVCVMMPSLLCGDAAGAPRGSELSFVCGTPYFHDPMDAA